MPNREEWESLERANAIVLKALVARLADLTATQRPPALGTKREMIRCIRIMTDGEDSDSDAKDKQAKKEKTGSGTTGASSSSGTGASSSSGSAGATT